MATDTSSSFDFGIPDELPILPLREFVVFPYMVLPIFVSRERSIAAVEDALAGDRLVLLTAQRNADVEDPDADDLHRVGTVAMVMRILRLPDGRVKALVQGLTKARIDSFVDSEPATWAAVSALPEEAEGEWCVEAEALMRTVRSRVEELLPLKNLPPEVLSITANVFEPGRLADLVASNLKLRLGEAQEVLEVSDPIARLRKVDRLLQRELDVTTMQAEIQSQAKEEISRGQREHYLREQLRAIQAELGEVDPRMEESAEYRMKIEEAGLPPEPLEEAMKQLRRFERMHPDGPEAQVVRSYLEWMTDLPWSRASRIGFSSSSACASCARIRRARSCVSSGRRASARPPSAVRLPEPWGASSYAFPLAVSGTRPRCGAIGGPTSARCPAASSRA